MTSHVVFVCVANRVRSVFAEFFFAEMLRKRNERLFSEVKISSAGFIPQKLKDYLAKAHVGFPNPFFNRPMSEITRTVLLEKGIIPPIEWRSKELIPEMIEAADLVITALQEQKEELINLFPKARLKIFTTREISHWEGFLIFERFTGIPLDDTYWDYVEENPDYVLKIIIEMERILIQGFPNILKQLGLEE